MGCCQSIGMELGVDLQMEMGGPPYVTNAQQATIDNLCHEMFEQGDRDKDGVLNHQEFSILYRNLELFEICMERGAAPTNEQYLDNISYRLPEPTWTEIMNQNAGAAGVSKANFAAFITEESNNEGISAVDRIEFATAFFADLKRITSYFAVSPEQQQAFVAKCNVIFDLADHDKDGLLNRQECSAVAFQQELIASVPNGDAPENMWVMTFSKQIPGPAFAQDLTQYGCAQGGFNKEQYARNMTDDMDKKGATAVERIEFMALFQEKLAEAIAYFEKIEADRKAAIERQQKAEAEARAKWIAEAPIREAKAKAAREKAAASAAVAKAAWEKDAPNRAKRKKAAEERKQTAAAAKAAEKAQNTAALAAATKTNKKEIQHKIEMAEKTEKMKVAKKKVSKQYAAKRLYMHSFEYEPLLTDAAYCQWCEKDLVGRYMMKLDAHHRAFLEVAICSDCFQNLATTNQKKLLKLDVSPCDVCGDHTYSKGFILQAKADYSKGKAMMSRMSDDQIIEASGIHDMLNDPESSIYDMLNDPEENMYGMLNDACAKESSREQIVTCAKELSMMRYEALRNARQISHGFDLQSLHICNDCKPSAGKRCQAFAEACRE